MAVELTDVEDTIRKYVANKIYSEYSNAKGYLDEEVFNLMVKKMSKEFDDQIIFVNGEIDSLVDGIKDTIDDYVYHGAAEGLI